MHPAKPVPSTVDRFPSSEPIASAACRLWHCRRLRARLAEVTVPHSRLLPRGRCGQRPSCPLPLPRPQAYSSSLLARDCSVASSIRRRPLLVLPTGISPRSMEDFAPHIAPLSCRDTPSDLVRPPASV